MPAYVNTGEHQQSPASSPHFGTAVDLGRYVGGMRRGNTPVAAGSALERKYPMMGQHGRRKHTETPIQSRPPFSACFQVARMKSRILRYHPFPYSSQRSHVRIRRHDKLARMQTGGGMIPASASERPSPAPPMLIVAGYPQSRCWHGQDRYARRNERGSRSQRHWKTTHHSLLASR